MFRIESPDFKEGGHIPRKYTCEGENLSPPLAWKEPPPGTKSYVLVLEDPDAPMGTFVHWVVFDLPPDLTELYRGAGNNGAGLENGMKHGMTDFGQIGYGGPCPPKGHGMHRYSFTLKAIDLASLGLDEGAKRSELERALKGHVLAETRITAVYQR
ncbi:MAG: YbhB/YbcL family Raf kinase inhibitor-like protein [Deltaproteobacteria bacterium]|nr:YbhB/YbcL family Raf kinase inhibitor-like protein [Deltaproteobacteria bacterium]MCL4874490.1 YbhB/YbcL family Raf kinase inhibitor-like protein [bacterium]